ncbi:alpha/beta fold hydrolase [Phycisphaerales bacterium ac7]
MERKWTRIYLILLVLSHLVIAIFDPTYPFLQPWTPSDAVRQTVRITPMDKNGPVGAEADYAVSVIRWDPEQPDASKLPILLLHGSPPAYAGLDFKWLAPRIAETGRVVYAIDRPGYGGSGKYPPSFSAKANAHVALATMKKLGIERAHIGGWSFGGAVAIWMAELEPERVASIEMIAATGVQEGEGSGSYAFEHFKYGVGYAVVMGVPELIPHFGLLAPRSFRHAFIRDFSDTDQREISAIVPELETPTLILQGRDDMLVPAKTSELHHELFPASRLVVMNGGHTSGIIPYGTDDLDMEIMLHALDSFLTRHDEPGRTVLEGVADFAPVPPRKPTTIGGYEIDPGKTAWWAMVLLIILGTFISEDLTVIAVGLLLVTGQIDYGVALLGCFLGIVLGDYGLWALGRFGGTRLLRVPLFKRLISEQQLEHWGRVLGRHTAKAVFLAHAPRHPPSDVHRSRNRSRPQQEVPVLGDHRRWHLDPDAAGTDRPDRPEAAGLLRDHFPRAVGHPRGVHRSRCPAASRFTRSNRDRPSPSEGWHPAIRPAGVLARLDLLRADARLASDARDSSPVDDRVHVRQPRDPQRRRRGWRGEVADC